MLNTKDVIKVFIEIQFLIENSEKYPNISREIQQIYDENPQAFLKAIEFVPQFDSEKISIPLIHFAIMMKNLEVLIAMSEIFIRSEVNFRPQNKIIDLTDCNNMRPLHFAILYDDFSIVEWLIEKGADVNAPTRKSLTPLMIFTVKRKNNNEIFSLLLEKKANIHGLDEDLMTVLHHAVMTKDIAPVKKLLDLGADINHVNRKKHNALSIASSESDIGMVNFLIKYAKEKKIELTNLDKALESANGQQAGEIVNIIEELLMSYELIQEPSKKVTEIFEKIRFLIDNSKDFPIISEKLLQIFEDDPQNFLKAIELEPSANGRFRKENFQKPLLHLAVRQGNLEVIKAISKIHSTYGIIPESYSNNSIKNAKHIKSISSREINRSRTNAILENNILKLKTSRLEGQHSLLHVAVQFNHFHIVKWLIDNGADVNASALNLITPLMISISDTIDENIFLFLLENRADPHNTNTYYTTALCFAVCTRKTNFTKKLLEIGVDVNSQSFRRDTPLFLASYNGNIEAVKILVEHAAKHHIKLVEIQEAIDQAQGSQKREIVNILQLTLKSYETWDLIPVDEEGFVKDTNVIEPANHTLSSTFVPGELLCNVNNRNFRS